MKKFILLNIFFLVLGSSIDAQNSLVRTTFYQDGTLYKNQNDFSESITDFKKNERCTVLDYLGKEVYKIRYKGKLGFVTVDDLEVTEGMMDLYYDFQEKARQKAVKERMQKERELAGLPSIEDSIAAVRKQEQLQLIAKKQADSIAEIQEQQRLALLEKQRLDSLAKAKEAKRLALIAQRKQDSIAQVRKQEQLQLIAKKQADSIAELKEQKRLALLQKQRLDYLAKAKEAKRLALIAQRKQDSTAEVRKQEQLQLIAKKQADSITQIQEQQRLALLEKQRLDSLAKDKEAKRLALIAQRKQDSIAQVRKQEEQQNLIENQKSLVTENISKTVADVTNKTERNTECKYLINEYDDFYNVKTIQTDPYTISEKLTIELYRLGKKFNVFFNLSENLGCASYMSHNRSNVKVKLENNQTVTFYHSWGMECGNFTFKGRISTSQMRQLQNSPIKSILLKGTKSSFEITKITDKYFFIDKLHCLEVDF